MAIGWGSVYISVSVLFSLFSSSFSYLDYNLESSKVCSLIRNTELELRENENSAILLKETRYFDKWLGTYQFICNFTVIPPWGHGIIAVIQNLNLRQNEASHECIDYVQFQKSKGIRNLFKPADKLNSDKYCGIVNSGRDPYVIQTRDTPELFMLAHNAFVVEKGHMEVRIGVADQRLLPPQKLDIAITFTAFKVCKNGDEGGLKECKKGSGICIWEGFFHDKNVNCPFDDCFDEGGCPAISQGGRKQSSGLGTKVTIGAVVLILGLLVLFMLCLCICRRCQVLCWSSTPVTGQQSTRVEMTNPPSNDEVLSGQNQPTAPPLLSASTGTSPVHEDKDLPPPYESLFPSR